MFSVTGVVAIVFQKWLNGTNSDVLRRVNLANGSPIRFPGGSRGRVNRAGNRVREDNATGEDLSVIDAWREAHRHVINSFQAILRHHVRGLRVIVAQRHKRKTTIFDKLHRFPKMQLSRMDDVAGCRLIFETVEQLWVFREDFRNHSRFNHKLKNDPNKYDYIDHPKESGYRGVHDVYEYDVRSETGRDRKGLLIELQYRTIYQHAWATCVEVIGFLTMDQPKFDRGDEKIKAVLRLASEIIARAWEGMPSCLANLHDEEVVRLFAELDEELHFLRMLRGLNAADREISDEKDIILIFRGDATGEEEGLEVRSYPSATQALRALFELERDDPGLDVVLVRGERPGDVREAFKNYFSDARQFIYFVEEGCRRLVGDRYLAWDLEAAGD